MRAGVASVMASSVASRPEILYFNICWCDLPLPCRLYSVPEAVAVVVVRFYIR